MSPLSCKWIDVDQSFNSAPHLQVLGEQLVAVRFQSGGNDQ